MQCDSSLRATRQIELAMYHAMLNLLIKNPLYLSFCFASCEVDGSDVLSELLDSDVSRPLPLDVPAPLPGPSLSVKVTFGPSLSRALGLRFAFGC